MALLPPSNDRSRCHSPVHHILDADRIHFQGPGANHLSFYILHTFFMVHAIAVPFGSIRYLAGNAADFDALVVDRHV